MFVEPHYIDVVKRRVVLLKSSYLAIVKAHWWGIKIKAGLKVYGVIHFRRFPNTKISVGSNCRFRSKSNSNLIGVNRPCMISTLHKGAEITIGNSCGFSGTVVAAFKKIIIGNNVKCGANTLITDSDWHPEDERSGEALTVCIGNNVWLGINSIVLKGVSIGENSIIGANSVVVKDVPANVVAAGNPCKVIKKLEEGE